MQATSQTIVRHGTGASIRIKSAAPCMVTIKAPGIVLITAGLSPITRHEDVKPSLELVQAA